MFFYEGLSCPSCQQPCLPSQDIVACPECGAPHHRDCWNEHGGCACAAAHGTDEQWSREKAAISSEPDPAENGAADTRACPHCGNQNSPYAEVCAACGHPLTAQSWQSAEPSSFPPPPPAGTFHEYAPFRAYQHPCGGVRPTTVINGETAEDLATVVGPNTPYYLPRFERMGNGGRPLLWNWAAFLIPSYWSLHRKQYALGGGLLLFDLVYTVLNNLIFHAQFGSAFVENAYGQAAIDMSVVMQLLETDPKAVVATALMMMLAVLSLILHFAIGLFGNRLYLSSCVRRVRRARESYPEGYRAQLSLVGGTSFVLAVVGYLCLQMLPSLILLLIL